MVQPQSQQMLAATMNSLVLNDLEDTLGFDSPDFFWLIRVIDAYFYGRIKVPALWIWIFKTLHDTGNLHLLDRCKIFVLDGDGLEQLDDYTLHVANLVHDSEAFKELWSDVGLPVGHVEWEVFDTQRRVRLIRAKEMEHREVRASLLNDVNQSARMDESSLDARPTQVANQPAHDDNNNNIIQTQSSTTTIQTNQMAGPSMEQQSPESSKSPVMQFGTSAESTNNQDTDMSQHSSKSPGPQLGQSDFTFEMPGGPVMGQSKPVDMPVTSAMSAAKSPITPNTMFATKPATQSATEPAVKPAVKPAIEADNKSFSTRKSTSTSKFSEPIIPAELHPAVAPHKLTALLRPRFSVETSEHVEVATPAITAASANTAVPGSSKRPVWKSAWKTNMPVIAQFPASDMRNEGKGKQAMGPPSAPSSAYKANGGPSTEHRPLESPDQYIEPLSDDEDATPAPPLLPTPAPDLVGKSSAQQAMLVYQQLLAHGERQKAVTGKYRSVADDIKAQVKAEKKAEKQAQKQAQKESEDVDMGGQ